MKVILYISIFVIFCSAYSMEKEQIINIQFLSSNVSHNPLINIISVEELRNVRAKSPAERKAFFQQVRDLFPLEKTIQEVNKLENPQVILWFTNYFGSVMEKTLKWYTENLFSKVSNATFWLTDLKAWSFLSVDKEQLKQTYGPLVNQLEQLQKAKDLGYPNNLSSISLEECPLINKSSDVVDKEIENIGHYKLLSSKAFFTWLLQNKQTTLVSDEICNQLCKEYPREDSLRFSLSDMGYKPELLNRIIKKTKGKTLLDVDFSLAYPILQYLEGIYYASTIAQTAQFTNKQCSIVFMLPNKEFTYYILPEEKEYFTHFCQGVQAAVTHSITQPILANVAIRFEPFAYGDDFYDAPYKFSGSRLKKQAFLKALTLGGKS